MEGKVAVLGDADFVMPFSALGLDTYPVGQQTSDITQNAQKILDCKYVLVVVAENVAKTADEVFATRQKDSTPCVVVVPFTTEPQGYATRALGDVLKMATGIDILQSK